MVFLIAFRSRLPINFFLIKLFCHQKIQFFFLSSWTFMDKPSSPESSEKCEFFSSFRPSRIRIRIPNPVYFPCRNRIQSHKIEFLLLRRVSHFTSVADPGCLSRIPDPDYYPSRIPDPGSRIPDLGSRIQKQEQKREVKKN